MASNAKATLIKRLASTPGRGTGANTGLGTADVVIPDFPRLPQKLNDATVREFSESINRWRISLQAQFPVPTTQATEIPDPSAQIAAAIDSAVEAINKQIEALSTTISTKAADLQNQIDEIDASGVTTGDVNTLIKNARYVHNQGSPSATWTIRHNLGWYPSVTAVDLSQNLFFGDVRYIDQNTCQLILAGETSGYAYVN